MTQMKFSYTIEVPEHSDLPAAEKQLRGAFDEDMIGLADWTCVNVTVEKTWPTRQKQHEALDKLLDAVDAGGYDNEEVTICVQAVEIEVDDNNIFEDVGRFIAEFASGEVEDTFVDRVVYKNGKVREPAKRQQL